MSTALRLIASARDLDTRSSRRYNDEMQSPNQKRSRRWLRFRLRTLLLLITVVGIALAVTTNAARRQKEARKVIHDAGGQVWYEYHSTPTPGIPNSRFNRNALPPGPPWLRELIGEDYFCTVNCVNLFRKEITKADLAKIAQLPDLITVNLYGTQIVDPLTRKGRPINDSDLGLVQHMKSLHNVVLSSTDVTDDGLQRLTHLAELNELYLQNSKVTNAGIEMISQFSKLKTLDVRGTGISREGKQQLRQRLPNTRVEWSASRAARLSVDATRQ